MSQVKAESLSSEENLKPYFRWLNIFDWSVYDIKMTTRIIFDVT